MQKILEKDDKVTVGIFVLFVLNLLKVLNIAAWSANSNRFQFHLFDKLCVT